MIPSDKDIRQLKIEHSRPLFIGNMDNRSCFSVHTDEAISFREDFQLHGLRQLFGSLGEKIFKIASVGLQIINWDKISKYCGKCGSLLQLMKTERAKQCRICGYIDYPRISPAVIMSVIRNDQILLARSNLIKYSFYSVLAGYVEFGETLEESVKREIKEEVSLWVKNVRYFGSQSWPFTNSLMVAFTAEYASGEINIDKKEIVDAAWFKRDNLPKLPEWGSISRRLVDSFVESIKK